jgi:thiol-disulfide isomerase/thioredoxin
MDDRPPPAPDARSDADLAAPADGEGSTPGGPGRHPDDLPAEPEAFHVPRGLLWALSLAVVVLVIASWVALSNGGTTNQAATAPGSDGVVRLSPNQTLVGGDGGGAKLGQPAPAVSWDGFEGGKGSMAALAGKPVVVNFWQSNCAPCVTEMPALQRVHAAMGDKVAFVGLDTLEIDHAAAQRLVERTGVAYPLGLDPNGQIGSGFGIIGFPTTALVDRNGTIVYLHLGEITEAELTKQINEKLQP